MIYAQALGLMTLLGGSLALLLVIADRLLVSYGPCTITINDDSVKTVEGGCTLLEALYDNRVFIPSACGGQPRVW